jgi:hypothetical protein
MLFTGIDRGPWLLIGRTPDHNPYGCTSSDSGTRVPTDPNITDSLCAVWTIGGGSSPNIQQFRNGTLIGTGIEILWFEDVLYLHGNDSLWYSWTPEFGYTFYGSTDPETGGGVPSGYFVSTSGNDSRTCMQAADVATPKLTIASGITCLSAGQTLYIRGGTYNEKLTNTTISGTSWAATKKIANYPGETVWMTPASGDYVVYFHAAQQYVEFDGINMDGSAMANGTFKVEASQGNNPHHIRVSNSELIGPTITTGLPQIVTFDQQQVGAVGANELINNTIHSAGADYFTHCIYVISSNNIIDGNNLYDCSGGMVHIYNGTYSIVGTKVRNNTIHDGRSTSAGQQHWGIIVSVNATQTEVYNNLVYGMPNNGGNSEGILCLYCGVGNMFYNNTVTANAGGGINIGNGDATPSGTIVKNNITYGNTGTDYQNWGTGTVAGNNLCSSGCAVTSDPVFVGGGNYHIQTSSPAKDAGVTLSTVFTTDKDGIPRPQGAAWDIGAYEFH